MKNWKLALFVSLIVAGIAFSIVGCSGNQSSSIPSSNSGLTKPAQITSYPADSKDGIYINTTSDDDIEGGIPAVLQFIDSKEYDEFTVSGTIVSKSELVDLYSKGFTSDVSDKTIDDNMGGEATIAINSKLGMVTYAGTIKVGIEPSSDGFKITSASLNPQAYTPQWDSLMGTWRGEFVETNASAGSNCYGGQDNPFVLTVKSVNNQAGTAVVDMGFLLHQHGAPKNTAQSYEGDTWVTLEDVTIELNAESKGFYEIYSQDIPGKENAFNGNDYAIELDFTSNGELQANVILDGVTWADSSSYTYRTDVYEMHMD